MFARTKHGPKHASLSPEARAWEAEQLRRLGLMDVVWEADACCPRCQRIAEQPLPLSLLWRETSLSLT